jgi:hypothetical protein
MTRISHPIQKHKFGITCRGKFFMESAPVPPEHEKYCIDVSHPGCTRIHYVTSRSHQMQKHEFGIRCSSMLFMQTAPVPPEHEKSCVDVSRPGCMGNTQRDPQMPPNAKTQVRRNISLSAFYGNYNGPTRA